MTDREGAVPTPWVLDAGVVTELARGDYDLMIFIQRLDAEGQPMMIPVLALAGAALDTRTEDAEAIIVGLGRLGGVTVVPVADTEQAVRLANAAARTGLGAWDAHVAAVADAEVCPILTLNGAKWEDHLLDLGAPLSIIDIAEPDGE